MGSEMCIRDRYRIDMQVHYRFIACAIMGIFLLIGFVNAASSAGTNPGFGSLPTSFEWEGDKILNGEDPTSLFTETKNGILDELAGAGMVMNSTSGPRNAAGTASAARRSPPTRTALFGSPVTICNTPC